MTSIEKFIKENKGKYIIWLRAADWFVYHMVKTSESSFQWMESEIRNNEDKDLPDMNLIIRSMVFDDKQTTIDLIENQLRFPWEEKVLPLKEIKKQAEKEGVPYKIYSTKIPDNIEELNHIEELVDMGFGDIKEM